MDFRKPTGLLFVVGALLMVASARVLMLAESKKARLKVAEPVLHRVNSPHRHKLVGWTGAFAFGDKWLDQGSETLTTT